jgi:hypothetical protein
MYKPTMSSTFSANAGSLERLKVQMRCGCSRCASQIRCNRAQETSTAQGPAQCVTSAGVPRTTSPAPSPPSPPDSGALPDLRLSRSKLSTLASADRCCQCHTAGRLTPTWPATVRMGSFSTDNRTIRARWMCFCGRFRSPTTAVNGSRLQ